MKGKLQASRFETVIIERTGFMAICQRCSHKWMYSGARNFACCPACHTSVVIRPKQIKEKMKKAVDRKVERLNSPKAAPVSTPGRLGFEFERPVKGAFD